MATSSITHNFIINDPAAAERFANALEEAEKTRVELKPSMGKLLTDPDDIKALLMKRKQNKNDEPV
jgi:hypothetical protein